MSIRREPDLSGWRAELAQLFHRLRHSAGAPASVREIARSSGYSVGYVSDVFHGRRNPRPHAAEAIAGAMNASPSDVALAHYLAARTSDAEQLERPYRLHRFPPPCFTSQHAVGAYPERLLDGRLQVVEFVGADTELESLDRWCVDSRTHGVQLIHAPAGEGKTRLAVELSRRITERGWLTLEARRLSDPRPLTIGRPIHATSGRNSLIIVDQADLWPLHELMLMVRERTLTEHQTTRIVLLARDSGHWWRVLSWRLNKDGLETCERRLNPRGTSMHDRLAIFDAAYRGYSTSLGKPTCPQPATLPSLSPPENRHALSLSLAALTAVCRQPAFASPPQQSNQLAAHLVAREIERWQRTYDRSPGHSATEPAEMARAALVAALAGPLEYGQGQTALAAVGLAEPMRVLDEFSMSYPPRSDPRKVLEPLSPSALALAVIALQLQGERGSTVSLISDLSDVFREGPIVKRIVSRLQQVGCCRPDLQALIAPLIRAAATFGQNASAQGAIPRNG